jgi:outer membrane protein TolC
MKKQPIIYFLFSLTIIAASCSVTKQYKSPVVGKQDLYRDQSSTDTNNIANLHWTEIFKDTLLQHLIQEGIDNNLDLKIAYSRTRQAQAYFEQSRLAFLPNVNAGASVFEGKTSGSKTSTASNSTLNLQLGITSNWEADLWGKLKSMKQASLASVLQSEAYSRAVQTDK